MHDLHYIVRRAHAIGRLFERYGISVSIQEYEQMAEMAQNAPQIHGMNVAKLNWKGRIVYAALRRNEISTFLSPDMIERKVCNMDMRKKNLVGNSLVSLAEVFES